MKNIRECSIYNFFCNNQINDKIELINFFGIKIYNKEIFNNINSLTEFLISKGVKKGDSIAINLPNIPNAIIAVYAINKCGCVSNIIHPLTPAEGLIPLIKKTNAKFFFTLDIFLEDKLNLLIENGITPIICKISDYLKGIKKFIVQISNYKKTKYLNNENYIFYKDVINNKFHKSLAHNLKIENPMVSALDHAVVLHSGGTSGEPKSIILSNYSLNSLAVSLMDYINYDKKMRQTILTVLPLFHGFGLGVCMHTGLSTNSKLILMPFFKARKAVNLIKKHKISIVAGVPLMYQKMMNEKNFKGRGLQSLKFLFCGGDKLSPHLKKSFDEKLSKYNNQSELLEGYGLTEVVTVCTVNHLGNSVENSVGKPLNCIKIKICDSMGNILKPMEKGEIYISGSTAMSGYFGDDDATKNCMLKDESNIVWIKTGDYGYLDNDNNLFFIERLKRLIKISGMNIFPAEIENIVNSMDEIQLSCVKEYEDNEKIFIELFVVLKKGYNFNYELENRIKNEIAKKLLKYCIPKKITLKASLPLTSVGKVDYNKL